MTPETDSGHGEILARLRELETVTADTNKRIRNMERRGNIGLVFKLIWIGILLLLPLLLFQYMSSVFSGFAGGSTTDTDQFSNTKSQLQEVIDLYRGQ